MLAVLLCNVLLYDVPLLLWNSCRLCSAVTHTLRYLQVRDDAGNEIGSKVCNIIGSDGGTVPFARDHPMPSTGLMVEVAYRWDVVCDFSNYEGKVRPRLVSRHTAAARQGPSIT